MAKRCTVAEGSLIRICEALPQLTAKELEQVRLRLGYLTPAEERDAAPAHEEHDWLLRGIEEELRRRGVMGAARLAPERIVNGWKTTSTTTRRDLIAALGGRPDPRRLAALGSLVARTLADYLAAGGVPVSPKTLLANAGKALVALDGQFPGYAEAGLLGCCLDPRMVGED